MSPKTSLFFHRILILGALLFGGSGAFAKPLPVVTPFDLWDQFLASYLDSATGKVNYLKINNEGQKKLAAVLEAFASSDPGAMDDTERKALYINLYNAAMISNILRYANEQKLDVASKAFLDLKINDIKVPGGNIWNGSYKVKLKDKELTLDNIEHDLIRGQAKDGSELAAWKIKELDPRIHVAVNCAALSCPRVREKAYRQKNVDQMLDENMARTLSDQAQFSKVSDSKLKANQIFQWYYSDFDDTAKKKLNLKGAGDYVAGFVPANALNAEWLKAHLIKNFNDRSTISLKLSPSFEFFYNWQINDTRN